LDSLDLKLLNPAATFNQIQDEVLPPFLTKKWSDTVTALWGRAGLLLIWSRSVNNQFCFSIKELKYLVSPKNRVCVWKVLSETAWPVAGRKFRLKGLTGLW